MRKIIGFLHTNGRLIFLSFSHSFLLVILTYGWMNLNFEFADDMIKVARVNEVLQYLLLDKKDSGTEAIKKNLLLINCSYNKMLVPYEDDRGSGTRAVIDRPLLTEMIRILTRAKPTMILFDIFLDNPSAYDSALHAELLQASPLIMSSYLNNDGSMNRPHAGLLYARAQYGTNIGSFLKYQLLDNDTIKYVPSVMYELTTGDTLHRLGSIVHSKKAWWLNSFIVDLPIRQSHIDNNEVTMWNLGDILKYSSAEEIQNIAKGKIVVIGDFYEFDIHDTLLGKQPGPLIIVNTYLGLLKGVPKITFWGFFFVWLLYFACTIYILQLHGYRKKIRNSRIFRGSVMKFIFKYFSYLVFFSLYTVLLYALTGKHFELILFALYFNLFEFLVRRYRKKGASPGQVVERSALSEAKG